MKSPTLVAVVPTFVLAPLTLARTCRRSGKFGTSTVRVQKFICVPLLRAATGVKSQLLIVPVPEVLSKLAAM